MKKSNFILIFATVLLLCGCTREKIKMRGTIKDYDGNIYFTVQIGDQVWMKENMRTKRFADGTPLRSFNQRSTKPSYASKDPAEVKYNGIAAQYKKDPLSKYTQGVCPNGWHLPSVSEWQELVNYYKEHPEIWDHEGVGNLSQALMSRDFSKDEYNFSALPKGYTYGLLQKTASPEIFGVRDESAAMFWAVGYDTNYPTTDFVEPPVYFPPFYEFSKDSDWPHANLCRIKANKEEPEMTSFNDRHYCSVRCVKDK